MVAKKKKEVDYEALNSPIMKIPRMNIESARDLIDLGIKEVYELVGRSPEVLFESIKSKKPDVNEERLLFLRMAVYYAETPNPDPAKLHAWYWEE